MPQTLNLHSLPLFLSTFLIGLLAIEARGQGKPEYNSARIVSKVNTIVASESPGIVQTIAIEPGSTVKKDDLLVQLNADIFQAEYDVAAAEVEIARLEATNRVNLYYAMKSAEVAEKTLLKSQNANQQYARTIPETEIERLNLELEKARLSGDQASLEFETAQWTANLKERTKQAAWIQLSNRTIRAPFDGTVAQIIAKPGQWINAGEPLVRLVDLNNLRVEGYFSQDLIRLVKPGTTGSFEYKIDDQVVQVPVEVTFVSPEIVEGIFQVWADLDNSKLFHIPGTQGKLTLDIVR